MLHLVFLVVIAALLGVSVAACGGGDDERSEEVSSALEELERATGDSDPASGANQATQARLDPPAVVRRYFQLIEDDRFREAWSYVAPALQAEFGGFESWKDGYGATVSTDVVEATPEGETSSGTTLAVRIAAVDSCDGQRYEREFAGDWTVDGASQLILEAAFTQVGGEALPPDC